MTLPLLTVTWKRCVRDVRERNISAHDHRYVRQMRRSRSSKRAGSSAWIASQFASKHFKRVVDEFPDSGYASDARQQLAALN